jgi:hypothetical protein
LDGCLAKRAQHTGIPPSDNADTSEVIEFGKQLADDPVGFLRLLMCRSAVIRLKMGRVLAHIGSKARIGDILALITMIADEYGDPAGHRRGLSQKPCGSPPEFPIVGADEAGAIPGRLISYIGNNRLPPLLKGLDGLPDHRVVTPMQLSVWTYPWDIQDQGPAAPARKRRRCEAEMPFSRFFISIPFLYAAALTACHLCPI